MNLRVADGQIPHSCTADTVGIIPAVGRITVGPSRAQAMVDETTLNQYIPLGAQVDAIIGDMTHFNMPEHQLVSLATHLDPVAV